ncbi:hypothetical protein GCM10010971_19790 [Silvimonas amylolytica]|uniref:Uncharacterized protein n=1 Tax=Silvimonas amylolytica TaxID=449663 RepID=A0ABQ2PLQ3_9NEIS|nr:hypothetical protein GCM10010971_19790 [Silvimonas amylolytica]
MYVFEFNEFFINVPWADERQAHVFLCIKRATLQIAGLTPQRTSLRNFYIPPPRLYQAFISSYPQFTVSQGASEQVLFGAYEPASGDPLCGELSP